jgi:hypothetical protein
VNNTRISLAVTLYTLNNPALVGNTYNLGFTATFGSTAVWAATYGIAVIDVTPANLVSMASGRSVQMSSLLLLSVDVRFN